MKPIISSISGIPLSWDEFYWQGTIDSLGDFGSEIDLHVNTKDEVQSPPHDLQICLFQTLLSDSKIYDTVIEALFRYYVEIRPRYVQAGEEWEANMPELTTPKQIASLITLNYIELNYPYDDNHQDLGFSFGCDWDREHGAGVMMRDGEVIIVGGADCIH